jgi:hypothetical protein
MPGERLRGHSAQHGAVPERGDVDELAGLDVPQMTVMDRS